MSETQQEEWKPARAPGVYSRRAEGDKWFVEGYTAAYELDRFAAAIWMLCDGFNTVADMEEATGQIGAPDAEHNLRSSILEVLHSLREQGFLR